MTTAGFAFVEFATPKPDELVGLFAHMGFAEIGRHKTLPVRLFHQGGIYFVLNQIPTSFAAEFSAAHGPAAAAAGFYVTDVAGCLSRAQSGGYKLSSRKPEYLSAPIDAIEGIGGSLIYVLDAKTAPQLFADFTIEISRNDLDIGLKQIDHLAYNVKRGALDGWAQFYKDVFGFREIRYFHIKGKQTALRSRALLSSCDTMRLTINESVDDQSQIAEFIETYKGEGIQHIALNPNDIYDTVESMRAKGVPFIPVPDAYYEALQERLPGSGENIKRMKENYILLDGVSENKEFLLQIVTPPVFGPLFFEVIQRKGSDGFGEGNFTALFEALERDQVARGVLKAA
ncbi:MAG: 4-hydroxyphenylpyruvate dioxygenase [Alphaproteobacteria bacterium]|nr:MAG: 4-hydroxyphenylpyruvate dioxygenase [Alphaproteobacteria bacterium]